jgi:hypothetical protein
MSEKETFVGFTVNGECGTFEFERSENDERLGLSDKDVFVTFNGKCIDIIPYGTPYFSYLKGERIKQQLEETWVDRYVDL